ncbi:unnamed protein product [Rotaria sordida]|uniref:Transmembrane protein n=1 Tax=Rotaria sordida TaxID=392033 RepID=A0A818ZXK0_9BILA|nr:unnamed protein product [Rotaria sordida]CAF3778664.1 unnamed protein product [Rotaria sordida]
MKLLVYLFISLYFIQFNHGKLFYNCRFLQTFYQRHSNIFQLDNTQTSLIVQPLYGLSNQSFSSLSIGIIYRLADTYLVPVPLLFQCSQSKRIYAPIDCEFTIVDIRSNISIRTSESTRIKTVSLNYQEYNSSIFIPIRGAYFKQSIITLKNCRLDIKENLFISEIFHIHIEFEQIINSSCQNKCRHSKLYECSSLTNTCQCRSYQNNLEIYENICIDTELSSNCSLTPERCRRICRISDQIYTGKIDYNCQCPLGIQRRFLNNMFYCELSECINEKSIETCPNGYICQQKRCIQTSIFIRLNQSFLSLSFIFISLLIGALLIIIILIISLIKMRSIKCIKFVHPYILSNNTSSSSPNKICEQYTKIDFFER